MAELLPYYERELGFLRRYARECSERYPKIAARLLRAGEVCEDRHIERMIELFALLNARVAKRLDDDYPEFRTRGEGPQVVRIQDLEQGFGGRGIRRARPARRALRGLHGRGQRRALSRSSSARKRSRASAGDHGSHAGPS